MNTVERETVAPEAESAAASLQPTASEELRDEALSQLVQTWQVTVDDIDITSRVLESIATVAIDSAPLQEDAETTAANRDRAWRRFVTKLLAQQMQEATEHRQADGQPESQLPKEFAVYADFSRIRSARSNAIFPVLSSEQEIALFKALHDGRQWARTVLVNANLYLIPLPAKQYLEGGVEPTGVFQAGLEGLMEAVDSFAVRTYVLFASYAVDSIQASIRQYCDVALKDYFARQHDLASASSLDQKHLETPLGVLEHQSNERQKRMSTAQKRIEDRLAQAEAAMKDTDAAAEQALAEIEARIGSRNPTDLVEGVIEALSHPNYEQLYEERVAQFRQKNEQELAERLRALQEREHESRPNLLHLASEAVKKYWQRDQMPSAHPSSESDVPAEFTNYLSPAMANKLPPLSAEQEKQLAQGIKAKKLWAREVLYKANLSLVTTIAKSYQDHGMDARNLRAAGAHGLQRAISSFDAECGLRFATYATHWIRQEMNNAISEHEAVVARNPSEWNVEAERQPPTPPHPPTAVGAPAPVPEPEGELRQLLQATVSELRSVHEELNTLRAEVAELRRERARFTQPGSVPPRPSTARLFPFAPPERG